VISTGYLIFESNRGKITKENKEKFPEAPGTASINRKKKAIPLSKFRHIRKRKNDKEFLKEKGKRSSQPIFIRGMYPAQLGGLA